MATTCLSPLNPEARFSRDIQRSPFSYFYKNTLYEAHISNKKDQITKEFIELGDDLKQFEYVYNFAPKWGPAFPFKRKIVVKSYADAVEVKDRGNRHFARKEYDLALQHYNRAILWAPWNQSKDGLNALAAAYANRSAVLFTTRRHIASLRDCKRALDHGYPESQRHKLTHRMAKIYLELRMPTNGMRCVEQAISELEESFSSNLSYKSSEDGSSVNRTTRPNKAEYAELKEKYDDTKVLLARLLEQAGVGAGDVLFNEDELLQPAKDCPSNYVANDADMYNRVSGKKNENFPAASSMIQLSYSKEIGRTFRARKDLKPGEILMLEKPFVSFLLPEHMMNYCLNCFDPCDLPIPCKNCCLVVFCSEKCREAVRRFHEIECPIMDMLFDEEIGTAAHLATRVLFSKTPAEWLEFAETPLGRSGWGSDQFHGALDDVYRSDDYRNVFTLVKNSSKRRPPDTWHLATIAVFLIRILEDLDEKYLPRDWDPRTTARVRNIMGAVLFRHLQNFPCNAHILAEPGEPPEIESLAKDLIQNGDSEDELEQRDPRKHTKMTRRDNGLRILGQGAVNVVRDPRVALGVAVYPTFSLVNHSCDPNCVRVDLGQTCALRVMRPISRGEHITCSYGPHYAKKNRMLRREELKARYLFKCDCRACEQDWPNIESLMSRREKFKCPHCDAPYVRKEARDCDVDDYDETFDYFEYICKSCNTDFRDIVKRYETGQREYAKHFAAVLGGKARTENGRFLELHIETLHSLLIRPSAEFHDCFTTLHQYYTGVE